MSDDGDDRECRARIESPSGGVGSARAEGAYSDGAGAFGPVVLRWNASRVWLERAAGTDASAGDDGATVASFDRSALTRGWFVPGFTERALGLALAGGDRPLVTTASFLPWLVIESRDRRRLSLVVLDRDAAYGALDALGLGPSQRPLSLTVWVAPERALAARWPRTQTDAARAGAGSLTGLVALDVALVAADLTLGALALSSLAAVVATLLALSFSRRLARMDVAADGAVRIARPEQPELALQSRKIESVRLTRTGFVVEYQDAPRPIAVALLSASEGARAIEGATDALAKLRAAHAVIDRAMRAGGR